MAQGPSASALAAVLDLVAAAGPRCGSVVVVAVDGRSGSGKTTLAEAVAASLGEAPVVHLDDLYPGWDGLAAGVRTLHDAVLEPLARGERAAYRRHDWATGSAGELVKLPVAEVLVVEGAGCSLPPCGRYEAVRVWLHADETTRRARGLARDGESYRPHWQRWADQEQALFAQHRPRDHAHLVLDTT